MVPDAPFTGFPPATLTFLRGLSQNNDRPWFEAHRPEYERDYLAPALAFVVAMEAPLRRLHPEIHAEPRVNGSLFRINRDIRFSRDKTPYKDHIDVFFWAGEGRSRERPAFFFRLRAETLILGAGMHAFDQRMLDRFREAVIDEGRGPELDRVVTTATAAGARLEGVGYKKVPPAFDPGHPRARYLLHNGLHAAFEEPHPASLGTPAFVDHCIERFTPLAPLLAWVAEL